MADNIIKVNVTSVKQQRVSVSSSQVGTEITASGDTGRFWAQTAKNWAVSDVIVDNTDYSSKHYALEAKESANNAQSFENATRETYNSFLETSANAVTEIQGVKEETLTEIDNSKTNAVDSINSTKTTILNDIEFVADGEKQEIEDLIDNGKDEIQELTNEIKENASNIINRVSLSMFDAILKDHVLTYEESKGLALQGTYVYKDAIAGSRYGYPDFYNKCLEERDEAIANGGVQKVTLGGTTISMYIHPNGHMYYDIAIKATIDNWFNTFGTAWFYGVDTENECIFLPRNNYFEQTTTNSSDVGKSVEAGLPNITGAFNPFVQDGTVGNGVFNGTKTFDWTTTGGSGKLDLTVTTFDASRSNATYGKSNTVQPNAVKKLLYICVGNQVQDLSTIDIVTQVDNGVKEIDDAYQSAMTSLQAVGPVLQTGSTMTGDLTINKPTNSWPTINFVSKGTMGEISDTVQYGARLISRDTRNQYFATYEHAIAENGRARAYMVTRSTNDDGATYSNHRLEVTCNPDGSGGTYIDGKLVKAFITQTYAKGTSGYNLYSNGYCEQWGFVNITASSHVITLLKSYNNTDYNILISSGEPSNDTGGFTGSNGIVQPKEAGSFKCSTNTAWQWLWWTTKGYIS